MISSIVSMPLPVDETFAIKKNRFQNGSSKKRICIVTGTHGDELEGQYVCFLVAQKLKKEPSALDGIVDIYPATNPLGIDSINRVMPYFDMDMNRTFPGDREGSMMERTAAGIIDDIKGADVVFDIHASNIYLTEIPQVRINELHQDVLVPMAQKANIDLIWIHGNSTVLESTFAYSLNSIGTPCLVVEMGVGMRLTAGYGQQLCDGIFNLMREMGMWSGETKEPVESVICRENDEVVFLNAPTSGMFMKTKKHGDWVKKGETIGYIFDPLKGEVKEYINADKSGWLFTIREYPLVDEGSLMGRILVGEKK